MNPSQLLRLLVFLDRTAALGSLLHEEAGEVLALAERDDAPENHDDECHPQAGVVQQQVKQENVYDHGAEKREPERDVAIYEQERTAHDLKSADDEDIV